MLSKTLIRETLIATLGTEPQVVSITLDRLLEEGHSINEVVVIHTESSGVGEALSVLQKEFVTETYSRIRLRTVPVESQHGPIVDFHTEEDLRALLGTLYREVCRVRRDGYIVHLSISGGRKVMAIMAMVVAQLLFGPNDRVWHLFTEGWEPGAKRRLHPGVGERIWLIPIPVLRWTEAGTLMRTVAELDDPAEVVAWY
ncbi:MAG TPA: CRISPR-associated protein Csx14, partial [Clostridia bacterium]|nr:CRISPR-associated protein Csx14 [Clostridia bacterium]